jgi:hypothetical protein
MAWAAMQGSRRLGLVGISLDRLIGFFIRGKHAYEMIDGLPEDAEVCGIGNPDKWWYYSPEYHEVLIVVASGTFPEVKEGEAIPRLRVTYKVM